jgi:hypothetical protein
MKNALLAEVHKLDTMKIIEAFFWILRGRKGLE